MKEFINNDMIISYNDGFDRMDEKEMSQLTFYETSPGLCIKDPDRHIIMTFAYKKTGAFVAFLASNPKEVARSMAKKLGKIMAPDSFQLDDERTFDFDGYQGGGFKYHYQAQGIDMSGQSYVIKKEKTYYYIHAYYRTELTTESEAVITQTLASIRWQ